MMLRRTALIGLLIISVGVGPSAVAADETTSLTDDRFPFAPAEQQVVSGETHLDPGTELTVRVRSDTSSNPFLSQKTTYITENGSFAAVFDMSDVAPNTAITITVLSNGTELVDRAERVSSCDSDCRDTVPEMPGPPEPNVAVEQGAVATIPVATDGHDTVSFSLGSDDVNYMINATLVDGNDDGEVPIRFDTASAGTAEPTLSVVDTADSLTITRSEPDLPSTLDAADYEYRIYRGANTSGTPDTEARMTVEANESGQQTYEVDNAAELGFERNIYRVQRGEIAKIGVSLGTADKATVSIGSPASDYEINATVRDGNGDDIVTLLFDTAAAGRSGTTLTAASAADSVNIEAGSELQRDTPVEAGSYDLVLYRGSSVSSPAENIGTLSLEAGNTTGANEESPRVATETNSSDDQSGALGVGAGALAVGGLLAIGGIGMVLRSLFN